VTREALIADTEATLEDYADGQITRKQCADWLYRNGWVHPEIESVLNEIEGLVKVIDRTHAENTNPGAGAEPATEANHISDAALSGDDASGPNSQFDSGDRGHALTKAESSK